MNILDLGFFTAIQSIQNKHPTKNLDELITVVTKSFYDDRNKKSLDKVFMSLQCAMESVLEHDGNNNYPMKHVWKDKILRESSSNGLLPPTFKCNPTAVETASDIVNHPELHYEYFDPVKHNQRKQSLGLHQVIDDVFDDEWDPEMQNGAVDESAVVAVGGSADLQWLIVVFVVVMQLLYSYGNSTCFLVLV